MNFQQFNEMFGPVQNINGGVPGIANLLHLIGTDDMIAVQAAPSDHVWTLLQTGSAKMLVSGFITTGVRLGHMITTMGFDHGGHYEVDLSEVLP